MSRYGFQNPQLVARLQDRITQAGHSFQQGTLADMGLPLNEVTFVVVDLETTGIGADSAITEIGAVKVRGGEVLGEFSSLVNPKQIITAKITALTGITNAMVSQAPALASVLASFTEFAGFERTSVLVAHNAPFDTGFLRRAYEQCFYTWPHPPVVDTLQISRLLFSQGEIANHRLGTLAKYFGTKVAPNHRALEDARATVDVLHGLFDMLGSYHVTHLGDLVNLSVPVRPIHRTKRNLAHNLPNCPGIYGFYDQAGTLLYLGSATDLSKRVGSYFTAAEQRRHIKAMLSVVDSVRFTTTLSVHQARLGELRRIAKFLPPYNRKSKNPKRCYWIRPEGPFPSRLVVSSYCDPSQVALGPFFTRKGAQSLKEFLTRKLGIRDCSDSAAKLLTRSQACYRAQVGNCLAPCVLPADSYRDAEKSLRAILAGEDESFVQDIWRQMEQHSRNEEFEKAASLRHLLGVYASGLERFRNWTMLANAPLVIGAYRENSLWHFTALSYGQQIASAWAQDAASANQVAAWLPELVRPLPKPARWDGNILWEEVALHYQQLFAADSRIIYLEGELTQPWPCVTIPKELKDRLFPTKDLRFRD